MASMNDDGQWIVMLGFIISIILVFLALIVNQSALVGKTNSESVLEFPKLEIQDLRAEIMEYYWVDDLNNPHLCQDLQNLSLQRNGAEFFLDYKSDKEYIFIHYYDGLTEYNEFIFKDG